MSAKPTVLTVYLSKGGVAKSTLAALIAEYLAALGNTVVLLDLDRQGSQSEIFDLIGPDGRTDEVLHQVLMRRLDVLAALTAVPGERLPALDDHERGELYVLQGGPQTSEAIDAILANPVRFKIADTLDVVRKPIRDLGGFADYVVMDMGPSDQVAALAGLVATDALLIPTTSDFLSVSRIAAVMEEVEVARQAQPLSVLGIVQVMTRYYFGRLRKSKTVQVGEEYLRTNYGDLLLRDDRGVIDLPYDEAWRNMMWAGQSVLGTENKARGDALRFLQAMMKSMMEASRE